MNLVKSFFLGGGGGGGGGVNCVLIQPLYNVKGDTPQGFCCFRSIQCSTHYHAFTRTQNTPVTRQL